MKIVLITAAVALLAVIAVGLYVTDFTAYLGNNPTTCKNEPYVDFVPEKQAGVKVGPGDAVLLRTGRWARRDKVGPWADGTSAAGFHASIATWLKARDVACLGSDAASEVMPSGVEGVTLPVHTLVITALGIHILDNQDLERLAETAAKLKRWEFQLVNNPVPVTGGTGSPLNTLAVF